MAAIKRFAAARVLSGLAGLAWIVLLARWMPVADFAAYSVLTSVVSVASIAGNLGFDRVIYRYVPSAHLRGDSAYVLRLVWFALLPRLVVASVCAVGAMWWVIQPSGTLSLYHACLAGGMLSISLAISDVTATTADSLMRFETQARLVLSMLVIKLAMLFFIHWEVDVLDVLDVLMIVLAVDLMQSVLSGLLAIRPALREGPAPLSLDDVEPLPVLMKTVPLAGMNYLSYLLSIPWQGSTARIVVGKLAATPEVALFGLLQTVADRLRLYLPIELLRSAFEPLLVRRYALDRNAASLVRDLELLRRLNFVILIAVAASSAVGGSEIVSMITAGKYQNAGPLAALIALALAVRSVNGVLWIGANVLGRMRALTVSYALITLVLLPLLWLSAKWFGAYGVAFVSLTPSVLVWAVLRWRDDPVVAGLWDLRRDAACLSVASMALAVGWMIKSTMPGNLGAMIAVCLFLLIYGLGSALLHVVTRDEIVRLSQFLRAHKG